MKKQDANTKDLTIYDKLTIPSFLPDKGGIEEVTICADVREKIRLTQSDIKKYNIKTIGNNVSWNEIGEKPQKVDFTELEEELIVNAFKKANEKKELPTELRFLKLYKKFMSNGKKE